MFSSVQFIRSVMSNSSWPHESQHARPPCPSPTPGVYSNSYPLSQWCHPIISSSVVPFSSCLKSFPASGYFPMSQLFTSDGQSIGVQSFEWTLRTDFLLDGLVGSLAVQGTLKESSPAPQFESINSFLFSLLYGPTLTSIYDYWKNHSFDYMDFVGKVMSLLFNTLSKFVIAFLPRS